MTQSNRLSSTRYVFSNFLQSPDEDLCRVSLVLVELYRRSGVSLLDTAIRFLETSPPQRSREVAVSRAGLCVDLINRLRFWVYVVPACTFNLVSVVVFCFQSFLSLKDIFKMRRFYVDEIFCVVIWSRDLRFDLKR